LIGDSSEAFALPEQSKNVKDAWRSGSAGEGGAEFGPG